MKKKNNQIFGETDEELNIIERTDKRILRQSFAFFITTIVFFENYNTMKNYPNNHVC